MISFTFLSFCFFFFNDTATTEIYTLSLHDALPIYEASDMKGTTTAVTGSGGAVLAFADWDQYIVVDRVGVSMLYEPLVKGTAGSIPTGQAGWYMFFRSSAGVSTPNAFRYLVNGSAA